MKNIVEIYIKNILHERSIDHNIILRLRQVLIIMGILFCVW